METEGVKESDLVTGKYPHGMDSVKPFIDNVSGSREYPESMAAEVKFLDANLESITPVQEGKQQLLSLLASPQPPPPSQPPPSLLQPPAPQSPPSQSPPSQPPPSQSPPSQPPACQPQPPAQGPASPEHHVHRQREGSISMQYETNKWEIKFKGDISDDILKVAVKRGSKAIFEVTGDAQTTKRMANMTVNDPTPSPITADTSNTHPGVTTKHTDVAKEVLAATAHKQPNESKEPPNKDEDHGSSDRKPDEEGVKSKAPAQDQAASLPRPGNQSDPQNGQLTTAATASDNPPPTEHI